MVLSWGLTMYEAAQTNVSTAGIWAIIVVAVACLAFWLGALALAARDPGVGDKRMPGMNRRMSGMMGPVLGGTHVSDCHRSVAPSRSSEATFADAEAEAILGATVAPSAPAAAGAPAAGAAAAAPGQRVTGGAPVPSQSGAGQSGAGQSGAPTIPAQQTGDADQPRRAGAGG
jgi:hypothetical protein